MFNVSQNIFHKIIEVIREMSSESKAGRQAQKPAEVLY